MFLKGQINLQAKGKDVVQGVLDLLLEVATGSDCHTRLWWLGAVKENTGARAREDSGPVLVRWSSEEI